MFLSADSRCSLGGIAYVQQYNFSSYFRGILYSSEGRSRCQQWTAAVFHGRVFVFQGEGGTGTCQDSTENTGFSFPGQADYRNLSPADIRKEGTGFDLPIAAALLCAFGSLEAEQVRDICMVGELSLNGEVKGVQGILPIVDTAAKAGCRLCIIPRENLKETEFLDNIPILGVGSLRELLECAGRPDWGAVKNPPKKWEYQEEKPEEDLSDIFGQEAAKRAAVIAAAGFHNLLLIGSRGAGKTMIASRIPGIFPGLSREEGMEVSGIYSAAGLLSSTKPVLKKRPFRAPHHTISPTALAGGGRIPRPGEITLAHKGVLFR